MRSTWYRTRLIAASCYSMPVARAMLLLRRRNVEFNWMAWLLAVFILACGTTHVMSIWTLMVKMVMAIRFRDEYRNTFVEQSRGHVTLDRGRPMEPRLRSVCLAPPRRGSMPRRCNLSAGVVNRAMHGLSSPA